jgi:thymidylate synthase ThyX
MEVKITDITTWDTVKKAALYTVGKTTVVNSATEEWVRTMLMAEHSPLREKIYHIELVGVPYWVANHFRTHFIGVNYYMSTSREDRTATQTPRSELPQDAPVNLLISANAQALINISRKRLCGKAHAETRKVWEAVKDKMRDHDHIMAEFMVKECVYRGKCHEIKPCTLK